MRALLDHCVPRSLRLLLLGHEVRTARQMGWASLRNGDLLAKAAGEFDVLLTTDQNLESQQNPPLMPAVLGLLAGPLERRFYRVPGRRSAR